MAARSAIEWTDATWNPVAGCTTNEKNPRSDPGVLLLGGVRDPFLGKPKLKHHRVFRFAERNPHLMARDHLKLHILHRDTRLPEEMADGDDPLVVAVHHVVGHVQRAVNGPDAEAVRDALITPRDTELLAFFFGVGNLVHYAFSTFWPPKK